MDGFLADGLTKLASLSVEERASLRARFDNAMVLNRKLFGEHSFRKSLASKELSPYRSVINISLFEVCAVMMSALPAELDSAGQEKLRNSIIELVADEDFARAITYSTNSTAAVQKRFDAMEKAASEVALG
jgi:hypothetical protein